MPIGLGEYLLLLGIMTEISEANWRVRGDPDPVDIFVGNRARVRRILLGMSQESVAAHLGISFQQLQKYENGTNRISASRLFDLAHALQIDIGYFFEDIETTVLKGDGKLSKAAEEFDSRTTIDLVREFHRIPSSQQRQSLLELIRTMAAIGTPST